MESRPFNGFGRRIERSSAFASLKDGWMDSRDVARRACPGSILVGVCQPAWKLWMFDPRQTYFFLAVRNLWHVSKIPACMREFKEETNEFVLSIVHSFFLHFPRSVASGCFACAIVMQGNFLVFTTGNESAKYLLQSFPIHRSGLRFASADFLSESARLYYYCCFVW